MFPTFSEPKDPRSGPNAQIRTHYHAQKEAQTTISKEQDAYLLSLNTLFSKRHDLRAGFYDLAVGRKWIEKDTGHRIWTHYHLAALAGKNPDRFCSGDYIAELQKILPGLSVSDYSYRAKKSRVVTNDGISEEIRARLLPTLNENRVYVIDRSKATIRKMVEADKKICRILEPAKRCYPQLDAMASQLHHLHLSTFLKLREDNGAATMELAATYNDGGQQMALVQRIMDTPKPYYPPVRSENPLLARLYTTEHGTIKSPLRRTFFKGCLEADLKNAHFAFLAKHYPHLMPATVQFLSDAIFQENLSIWTMIMDAMGIDHEQHQNGKKFVKSATYGIQYGLDPAYAQDKLYEDMTREAIWNHNYLDCIYIKELIQATNQCKKDIEEHGGMQGAFGWITWDPAMDINSFMANVLQTNEIVLIYPCFLLAARQKSSTHASFDILLHQHDGFTFLPRPGEEQQIKRKLERLVLQQAAFQGITTTLTFK